MPTLSKSLSELDRIVSYLMQHSVTISFFFFWLCCTTYRISVPQSEIEAWLWQWHLTTGPPENSCNSTLERRNLGFKWGNCLQKVTEPANLDVFILLQVRLLVKSAFLLNRTSIAERAGGNHCCSLVTKSCPTVTLWTIAHQASLSMGFSGKNTEVGCLFLLQGIFPTQGSNPHLLLCRQIGYH